MAFSHDSLPDLFSGLPYTAPRQVLDRARAESELVEGLGGLGDRAVERIRKSVKSLAVPCRMTCSPSSTVLTNDMAEEISVSLKLHHGTTSAALTKLAFETVFCEAAADCGRDAELAPVNTPGFDMTLDGRRLSLKTEAHKQIKSGKVLISKLMELGAGEWTDRLEDFEALKLQVADRLHSFDLILVFRRLIQGRNQYYELLSIDPALLLRAMDNPVLIKHESKNAVKPGEIDVKDDAGDTMFRWKFDGGGERKLTIEHLRRDLCEVHGTWLLERLAGR